MLTIDFYYSQLIFLLSFVNFEGGPGVPQLNFEGSPGVPLLNFEGGPGVPLFNFRGYAGPTLKL